MALWSSGEDMETEKKRFKQARIDVIYSFFLKQTNPFYLKVIHIQNY